MSWGCPREGPSEQHKQPTLGLEARSEVAVWEAGGWGRRPEASGPCAIAGNIILCLQRPESGQQGCEQEMRLTVLPI